MVGLWPILLALALFFGSLLYGNQHDDEVSASNASAQVLGGSFLTYRAAVSAYAMANPSVTGVVQDSSLSLPAWFKKDPSFRAYAQAGRSFTWFTPSPPRASLTDMGLYPDRAYTASVGIAQNGVLVTPTTGVSAIALPAAIPNGSIVYIN